MARIMNLGIQTITGRILGVGPATFDAHCHTYDDIDVETAQGVLSFRSVMAASVCDEVLAPGRSVTMVVSQTPGKRARLIVWAVLDRTSGRVFKNEELFEARKVAVTQACIQTLIAPVVIPVGLLLALVPGLMYAKSLWGAWSTVASIPGKADVEAAVAAMSAGSARAPRPSFGLGVA
jgi:hypothetical protein